MSAKTQNACLAALSLAVRHPKPEPVSLKTIADEQRLSSQFLVQVLSQLKRAGLVCSTRGASGGYRLTKSPSAITLFDLVAAMEGHSEAPAAGSGATAAANVMSQAWTEIQHAHHRQLRSVTLASLCEQMLATQEDMYYI